MNVDGWIPGHWSVMDGVNSNDGDLLDTTLINAPSFFLTVENLISRMEKNKEMVISLESRIVVCFELLHVLHIHVHVHTCT